MKYIHLEEVHNTKAAEIVVPKIIDLFSPNSVIDVGCGTGTWLNIFDKNGIEDYIGVDGEHVRRDKLMISSSKFIESDLEKPFLLNRKFDLLICLEVAEHLTEISANRFIGDLTKLSDIIVFSAAIPLQGGQNHLNEQYPSYWINYFKENNYDCYDIIRPLIWNNNLVDWWYRQNVMVFIKRGKKVAFNSESIVSPLISQNLYEIKLNQIEELKNKLISIENGEMSTKFYFKNTIKGIKRKLQYLKKLFIG